MVVDRHILVVAHPWFDYYSLYITQFLSKLAVLTPCALALFVSVQWDYWTIGLLPLPLCLSGVYFCFET